jgi:beta-galactosidase
MQKNNQYFFLVVIFFLLLPFFSLSQISSTRQKINFDEGWKFHLGNASNPEKDFNYSIANIFAKSGAAAGTAVARNFDDSSWRNVNLPHDWAVELPFVNMNNADVESHGFKPIGGLFPETSIGWYRKHFTINKSDSAKRFQIQFDGIFRDANIWINGFYLGNNKSGYVGVYYDITDFLNFDKENIIVVRVDATQYEGWFYEGAGIYRHTWLHTYAQTHITTDGIFAYAKIENNKAKITVETNIVNESFSSSSYSVSTFLTDRNGKKLAASKEQNISLQVNEEKNNKQIILLNNPTLWDIENPYLYRVVAEIKKDGKVIDSKTIRFGIRTIAIKTNGVFLNGKHVKIKGTNNHHDHAGLGSALPDYLQYYRIELLKNMGSNAYRTSHNAPTPELLDACDSLGMLVMDEQRLLNSGTEYMSQFERLMKRDRNHASIFMWSIGNEEGWIHTTNTGKKIAKTFIAKQQQLDPTRTCTYAADVANVFNGVNEVIPVRSFNYRQYAVADYHQAHPTQPLLGTEMGSTVTTRGIYEKDTVRAYLPDQDITAPWWASTAEEWWKLAAPNDYWLGGFVWTGFDYRGEPTPYHWPNINSHFGIMDMCGFPKNIYYYYQSWWTDKDVLHISANWNQRGNEGKPTEVWVNTNADDVELFLNGKSLGKKNMPRNGHLTWMVNYESGKLEAIALKKGKKITAKLETTNQPTTLIISPSKANILADGKDATILNVTVIDTEGREVPDANNLIYFSIKGDAKIIAVGNGDPSSHELDKCEDGAWQRHLFNGKCQVIVQAGSKGGVIQFEAKSTDLITSSINIISTASQK